MLEAAKWRHLPVFFLLSLLACPAVFGLFKKDKGPLVENAVPGILYLFMFPRTATTPSQAALNLKVETWLKWENIRFHRLSNQFILGSQTHGTAPYAYYLEAKGKEHWIDGSDAIIDFVANTIKKDVKRETLDEKRLRNAIDNTLFKVLMLDRATRNKQTGVGGLDWMLRDEGIAVQIMPALVSDMKLNVFKIGNVQYQIHLNLESWKAYFDLYNFSELQAKIFPNEQQIHTIVSPADKENDQEKLTFLRNNLLEVNGKKVAENDQALTMDQWKKANDAILSLINTALRKTFKALVKDSNGQMQPNPPSSEAKLDKLLDENTFIDHDKNKEEKTFNSLYGKGNKVLALVKRQVNLFLGYVKKETNLEYNNFNSPVYASMFGVLIQFFETPLNIKELNDYFEPKNVQFDMDVKLLMRFVKKVKNSLKLSEQGWKKLTQKPWTLNYEHVNPSNLPMEKYSGPFRVETGDLKDVFDDSDNVKEKLEPAVVAAAVEKITKYVNVSHSGDVGTKKKMVRIMAAYLCNLGEAKTKNDKKCAEEHTKMANGYNSTFKSFAIVKRLTYDAIVEYNEGLVRMSVMKAVGKAQELAKSDDPEIAASAASLTKIGNEL